MSTQKNAARVAVQAEPCQQKAVDAFNYAESRVVEALAISRKAVGDAGTEAEWGAVRLIDWLDDQFEEMALRGTPGYDCLEDLSGHIASVIAIVDLVNKDKDNIFFRGIETILTVAKTTLDSAFEAMFAERRAAA
ncbi:hypothetical protein [Diaphorobacter sp.]|uniref:hypothetical protein n=1 Tax=Diaphorobacter sp. TaxID=1934310 RepID=UPI0028ABB3EB|nr:hypothetical protein [Diaphorobacter sp.]